MEPCFLVLEREALMGGNVAKLRRRLRNQISAMPSVYLPLFGVRNRDFVVERGTDVVVEAFPRSGNSFLEAMIRLSAPHLRIAHHSHAAAQVIYAVRQQIPSFVIARDPDSAVSSLVVKDSNTFDFDVAFSEYVNFYSSLYPRYASEVRFVSFDTLKENPHMVVSSILGSMGIRECNLPSVDDVYEFVDELTRHRTGKQSTSYSPKISQKEALSLERRKYEVAMSLEKWGCPPKRRDALNLYASILENCFV